MAGRHAAVPKRWPRGESPKGSQTSALLTVTAPVWVASLECHILRCCSAGDWAVASYQLPKWPPGQLQLSLREEGGNWHGCRHARAHCVPRVPRMRLSCLMEGVEEGSAQSLQHQQLRPVATVITCSVFDLLLQLLQAPALSALCMYRHTSVMHVLCMRYLRAMRAA